MPDADTVWLVPREELVGVLHRVGLQVGWESDYSASHLDVAASMTAALTEDASYIAAHVGQRALDELIAAHQLWTDWLKEGRVRKLAFVATKASYNRTALKDDVAAPGGETG